MKYISLFTGIGGFDLALSSVGMECVAQVEIDKSCLALLERRFPDVRRFADVREFGRKDATADLICGGFPCQDLSVAGKRAGLAGERSGLWFEFARVINEIEPKWVVIENVPGLLSSGRGRDFAVIVQWLAERGYGVSWRILDAQYFGVPQRRRRVFIVGSLGDGRSAEVLFEREGSPRDTAPRREKREKIANDAPTSTLRGFGHGWQGQHNDTNAVIAFSAGNSEKSYGIGAEGNVTPPLKSGESGTNRVPTIVFDEAQITSKEHKSRPSKISQPLNTIGRMSIAYGLLGDPTTDNYIVREQLGGVSENIAYNIQQNDGGDHKRKDRPNGGMYVNETDKSLTVGGTDQTVIAFQQNQRDEVRDLGDAVGSINSEPGMHNQNFIATSWTLRGGKEGGGKGYLGSEEMSMTLGGQEQYLWEMSHADEAVRESGDIVPTLQQRMGTGGNQVPMIGVRRLTPTECERLQGFPDGWTEGQSDSTRYRQLGNAVAVPVVEWIAKRIVRYA